MTFRFGRFELDERRMELLRDGARIEVRPKPFALLAHLVRNRDRFVPVRELLEACWPGVNVSESALHSAVKLARKSLAQPGARPEWIESRRGRGYRFVGEVEVGEAAAARPAPAAPPPPDLIGRAQSLEALDAALRGALAGQGRVALLRGEAGIGKSRLLAELTRRAALAGARVASGACAEDGGSPPFWPWRQILRDVARDTPLVEPDAFALAELARLAPELVPSAGAPALPEDAPADERRYRLFDAVCRWLARAAEPRGLLVLLDDAHAADESSLGLLEYAARELVRARVLIVAAERDPAGTRGPALTRALGVLARQPHADLVQLDGLDRLSIGALVARLSASPQSPERIDDIALRSRGNPFFVRALLRAPAGSVPAQLRDVLRARLARLPERCAALLAAAAVIGREFDAATLARTADCAPDALAAELGAALREGFVEELPGRYRFEHALVREAILAELPRSEVVRLHARVADALAAAGAEAEPERIARHYQESGAAPRAFEFSRRAGLRALELLAFEDAVGHFERALAALELEPHGDDVRRGDLLLRLARARSSAGRPSSEVRQAVLAAGALARERGDADALTRAALALDFVPFGYPSRDADVVALLEQALARRPDGDDGTTVRLLCRLAAELRVQGGSGAAGGVVSPSLDAESAALVERAVAIAERLAQPQALASARWAQVQAAVGMPPARRAALASDAAQLAEQVGRLHIAALARWQAFFARLALGEPALERAADEFAERFAPLALPLARPLLLHQRGVLAFLAGDLERAERELADGAQLQLRLQDRGLAGSIGISQMLCVRERGASRAQRDTLARLLEVQPTRLLRLLLADTDLWLGDEAAARAQIALVLAGGVEGLPQDDRGPVLCSWLAELAHALRDAELAAAVEPVLAPLADQQIVGFLGGVCLGAAARYAGLAAHAQGQLSTAAERFEQALELNERSGSALWLAHAQLDCAQLLRARRRAGDRERAVDLLEQAGAFADTHPLGTLRERVRRARLEARGVTPLSRRRGA